jgi:hypothetical protein
MTLAFFYLVWVSGVAGYSSEANLPSQPEIRPDLASQK